MALFDKLKEELDRAGRAAQGALDEGKIGLEAFRTRQLADKAAQALGYAVFRAKQGGGRSTPTPTRVSQRRSRRMTLKPRGTKPSSSKRTEHRRRPAAQQIKPAAEPPPSAHPMHDVPPMRRTSAGNVQMLRLKLGGTNQRRCYANAQLDFSAELY